MDNVTIGLIFDELKAHGQCRGRCDFSSRFLGKEASYYRSLQSKGRKPSVEAQLFLARRLRDLGLLLKTSEHAIVASAGQLYLKLSAGLIEALLHAAHPSGVIAGCIWASL